MNKKIVELLRPVILKLKEFMIFANQSVAQIRAVIEKLSVSIKNVPVPEGVCYSLICLLDVLVKLDSLKDMKASIKNDFSRYRRALSGQQAAVSNVGAAELMEEQMQLQPFL